MKTNAVDNLVNLVVALENYRQDIRDATVTYRSVKATSSDAVIGGRPPTYRVVQKTVPQFYFCDNFRKCTPILTIFSLLEPEIYDA